MSLWVVYNNPSRYFQPMKTENEGMLVMSIGGVSVGINTLTVYVPDRTHLNLKEIKLNTLIGLWFLWLR